jgi:hypothetical protein
MFSDALRFSKANFQTCFIGLVISILTTIALTHFTGIVTAFINLSSYFLLLNFLVSSCEIIKNENKTISTKETYFRFDSENKDAIIKVLILALLLGGVVFIATAPINYLLMTPFEAEIKAFMSENRVISIILTDLYFVISAFYSVFFTISIAATIYYRKDAIESIKNGFRTTIRLKVLLFIALIVSAIGFIPFPEILQKRFFRKLVAG